MSRILIKPNPVQVKEVPLGGDFLNISEFFYDTIQGEGIYTGTPAAFLRLQGCTLRCQWCDTKDIWKVGNPYSFSALFKLMEDKKVIAKLYNGMHLVITGGSPLLQQLRLVNFINAFIKRFNFKPFIELENECVLPPVTGIVPLIDCWNNSPKLRNSGNVHALHTDILSIMSELPNSWFKFVIGQESDWNEIQKLIDAQIIRKHQILLMPLGQNRQELQYTIPICLKIAIKNQVRYSSRMHIELWGSKKSV